MSGYNKYVGDRMLLRQGKEAEKEGSHAGDSLFFSFFQSQNQRPVLALINAI